MSQKKSSSFEEVQKECSESFLKMHQIATLSRSLEGKLLTICDAIVTGQQNKAAKDLIRDALREFRFKSESVAGECGDEYSIGISTLDIKETDQGFAFPTMYKA